MEIWKQNEIKRDYQNALWAYKNFSKSNSYEDWCLFQQALQIFLVSKGLVDKKDKLIYGTTMYIPFKNNQLLFNIEDFFKKAK